MKGYSLSRRKMLSILLLLTLFTASIYAFHISPLKWYLRQDCLCGRAYFHPGETFSPDEILFREIGNRKLSDGVVTILATDCEMHHVHVWITIWGSTSYSVRGPEN